MRRQIPVLIWSEVKGGMHFHRPHGCMHDDGKVYIPKWSWGTGKTPVKKKIPVDVWERITSSTSQEDIQSAIYNNMFNHSTQRTENEGDTWYIVTYT